MITAIIILSCVTFFSLLVSAIAMYSAYRANKSNNIIAEQFTRIVMDNSDRIDVYKDGNHTYSSINFPNSEGF